MSAEPNLQRIKWRDEEVSPDRLYLLRELWKAGFQVDENTPVPQLMETAKNVPGLTQTLPSGVFVRIDIRSIDACYRDLVKVGVIHVDPMDFASFSEYSENGGILSHQEFDRAQHAGGSGVEIGWHIDSANQTGTAHYFVTAGRASARSKCGLVATGELAPEFDQTGRCKRCSKI